MRGNLKVTPAGERGSSLAEALIAGALLTTGMLAYMLLAVRGNALIRADLDARAALRVAASEVELEALRPRITPELYADLQADLQMELQADRGTP